MGVFWRVEPGNVLSLVLLVQYPYLYYKTFEGSTRIEDIVKKKKQRLKMEMQLRCITTSQDIGRDGGFGYIPAESKHGNLNASSAGGCYSVELKWVEPIVDPTTLQHTT
ncbi:hypothetical protein P8452_30110 [Trifolium repens]|nr:hypothetical protein P8452_30110 [Trifolium repens]